MFDQLDYARTVFVGKAPAVVIFGAFDHALQQVADQRFAETIDIDEDFVSGDGVSVRVFV